MKNLSKIIFLGTLVSCASMREDAQREKILSQYLADKVYPLSRAELIKHIQNNLSQRRSATFEKHGDNAAFQVVAEGEKWIGQEAIKIGGELCDVAEVKKDLENNSAFKAFYMECVEGKVAGKLGIKKDWISKPVRATYEFEIFELEKINSKTTKLRILDKSNMPFRKYQREFDIARQVEPEKTKELEQKISILHPELKL